MKAKAGAIAEYLVEEQSCLYEYHFLSHATADKQHCGTAVTGFNWTRKQHC